MVNSIQTSEKKVNILSDAIIGSLEIRLERLVQILILSKPQPSCIFHQTAEAVHVLRDVHGHTFTVSHSLYSNNMQFMHLLID